MTDTQEIARIRAAMESGVTGWGNVNTCWITGEDDDGNEGLNIVGAVIEDEMYPVLEIDTAQYFAEAEGPKLAEYYAACNPAAMTALLAHIDAQAAEFELLKADAPQMRETLAGIANADLSKWEELACPPPGFEARFQQLEKEIAAMKEQP